MLLCADGHRHRPGLSQGCMSRHLAHGEHSEKERKNYSRHGSKIALHAAAAYVRYRPEEETERQDEAGQDGENEKGIHLVAGRKGEGAQAGAEDKEKGIAASSRRAEHHRGY